MNVKDKNNVSQGPALPDIENQDIYSVRINFVKMRKSLAVVITHKASERYFTATGRKVPYAKITLRGSNGNIKYEKTITGNKMILRQKTLPFVERGRPEISSAERSSRVKMPVGIRNSLNLNEYAMNHLCYGI